MQRMKPHTHKRPNGFSKNEVQKRHKIGAKGWLVQKYQISHTGPKLRVYSCERLSSTPF